MQGQPTRRTAIPAAVRKRLTTEYDRAGFMDRYGGDLWLVTIVFTCALVHVFRYQIKNFLHSLKANWEENRNNPLYMPIAGHVYREPGQTPGQATMQNFSSSLSRIITEVVRIFMIPILFVMSVVSELIAALVAVLNAIRAFFNYLRTMIGTIVHDIVTRMMNVVVPMQGIAASAKGLLGKASGLLAGLAYVGSGGFLGAGATLLWIVAIVLVILILVGLFVVAMIALAYAVFPAGAPFGWVGIVLSAVAAVVAIAGIVGLVWATPLYVMVNDVIDGVLDAHTHSAPSLPMCFDGDTPIEVSGGKEPVSLRNVTPGTVLSNGDTVTASFVLLARGQDVCRIGTTIVTGNHSVHHPEQGWIAARDHPESQAMPEYDAEHVYCINTSSKRIRLDGRTFADWDDLDEADFETLRLSKAPLPERFGPEDIHPCLAAGHRPSTKVRLADGSSAAIQTVVPGTRLLGGGTCLGHVELSPRVPASGLMHHLVVDTGRFKIGEEWTAHYDAGIEAYLDADTARELFI